VEILIEDAKHLETLIAYIASKNHDLAQSCLHLDSTVEGIAGEIEEMPLPFHKTFKVARRGEQIVGVLGLDVDEKLKTGWLLGPYAEEVGWSLTVKRLIEAWQPKLGSLEKVYNFVPKGNQRVLKFMEELGAAEDAKSIYSLSLKASDFKSDPSANLLKIESYEKLHFETTSKLHKDCFREPWKGVAEMIQEDLHLGLLGDEVVAYINTKDHKTLRETSVDFFGVSKEHRRQGFGKFLLSQRIEAIFAKDAEREITLTVRGSNEEAFSLYRQLGFLIKYEGIGMCLHNRGA
jgi:ribosomal protein S18 acetylase RimI-like enzyme